MLISSMLPLITPLIFIFSDAAAALMFSDASIAFRACLRCLFRRATLLPFHTPLCLFFFFMMIERFRRCR